MKPTLIFLHGFLATKEMWSSIELCFSKEYATLSLNFPGHGNTPTISDNQTMKSLADWLKKELDARNINNAILIGHSMGGYVALEFGKNYPNRVLGISLLNSTANEDSTQKKEDRLRAVNLVKKARTVFIREAIPNLFAPSNKEKYKAEILQAQYFSEQTSKEGIISCLKGMRGRKSNKELLSKASFPIQLIIGKEDLVIPFSSMKIHLTQKQVKNVVIIDNCGHMGHIEALQTVIDSLTHFITTIPLLDTSQHT